MAGDAASRAAVLLRSGQAAQAMDVLGRGAEQGDPGALEMLAEMALTGEVVHRDLSFRTTRASPSAGSSGSSACAPSRPSGESRQCLGGENLQSVRSQWHWGHAGLAAGVAASGRSRAQ